MKYTNTIIFDLDGTLLDTLSDLTEAVNEALKFSKLPETDYENVRKSIGNGIEMLIRRVVPNDCTEEKIQECFAYFKLYYSLNFKKYTKPFDGILNLLTNLKKKGFKIAVLSNKTDKTVKALCRDFFEGLTDVVIGENPFIEKKPAPDGIFKIIKELEAEPDKTVMVGDSDIDIQTAKNAGICSIGVLWGYRDEKTLIEAGADELVDSPERLEFIL